MVTEQAIVNDLRVNHVLSMAGNGTQDFNCWGASQYVTGVRNNLGWVEIEEMSNWLTDHTTKVNKPQAGDILTLFAFLPVGKLLLHTAVYIGDGKYLHKLGMLKAEVTNLRTVVRHYAQYQPKYEIRRIT